MILAAAFAVLGLLHILPGLVALTPARMVRLYGIDPEDGAMATLMQHRALMLGLIGALLLAAALWVSLRPAALCIGVASMAGFVAIAAGNRAARGPLLRIVIADLAGLAVAAAALVLMFRPEAVG